VRLEAIYQEHRRGLVALALSVTRSVEAAEDAVHDAFIRLCKADRDMPDAPVAYVYRAVRNAAIDKHRSRKRTNDRTDTMYAEPDAGVGSPAVDVERSERDRLLRDAVEDLPEEARQVVLLRVYSGLTFDQIAEALELPMGTVNSRYRRALDKLRESVESLV
jgi:RNA polymerase sigma-70 factor (ECF subfamily)